MNKQQQLQMKIKQAFSTALGPVTSNIPMLLMAWLTGSSVSYINLMFTATLISNFVNSVSNVNEVFKKYTTIDKNTILILKVVYLIACCGILGIAVYKFSKMGILPNRDSDFLPSLSQRMVCFFLFILSCYLFSYK
ncbi:hypothetical protein, conserved [Entamoeba dispar SAW760]|uniref:ER membrane protein complex subunit 4 n=1 Tax=Entamoeba dispar (strain ATCC PRA-260 / SAW760) TaxID=370354 RepID=B0ETD4_ENTDS|nr:uncharacterized protein EDI_128720 [Entamoeba dispar SAW760]EDR22119.1 hypothetical protein, conserved [Entamoeba dispar SAW760]|eukprot:EDR22119.1 hypothetical protein, conserved [Entamoeba dispar SAW760]